MDKPTPTRPLLHADCTYVPLAGDAIAVSASDGGTAISASDAKNQASVKTTAVGLQGGTAVAVRSASDGTHEVTTVAVGNNTSTVERHAVPSKPKATHGKVKDATWENAPSCPFPPTPSNSVKDKLGRRWGWANKKYVSWVSTVGMMLPLCQSCHIRCVGHPARLFGVLIVREFYLLGQVHIVCLLHHSLSAAPSSTASELCEICDELVCWMYIQTSHAPLLSFSQPRGVSFQNHSHFVVLAVFDSLLLQVLCLQDCRI